MPQFFRLVAEQFRRVGLCEIATDRVRFPKDKATVVNCGDRTVRVHRPVFRRINNAERLTTAGDVPARTHGATGENQLELGSRLSATPKNALRVRRIRPSPDFERHRSSSLLARPDL